MLLSTARRRAARWLLTSSTCTATTTPPLLRALSGSAAEASSSASASDRDEFRSMVADFAAREIAPHAEAIDRTNAFPKGVDLWAKLGEFGLLGITAPADQGGLGLGYSEHVIAMEELSRASGSVALSYGAHSNLCVNQIVRNGTAAQKARFLPRLLTGEAVGALAMSEAGAGSDVVGMRTKATRVDGGWRLDGTKMWCTNGTVAETLIVYAKTDPGAAAHGITAFLVEKGMPGFSPAQKLDKLGMRGSDTCELVLDGVVVPDENVLGEVNKGVYVMFSGLDYERLVLAGGPVGLAAAALDVAVPYAATRVQGGKAIGDHQLVGGRLADMHVRTAAARALVMEAAARADGAGVGDRRRTGGGVRGAILFAAEAGTATALDAIQVLGGNGYINDYPTGRLLRDAKLYEIGAGTSEVRRVVVSRALVGAWKAK